jgi:hypothetical protein
MYEPKVIGLTTLTGGSIVLPNTGGHIILTVVALTSITIGAAIMLSVFGRWVAKKVYTQA